MEKAGYTAVRNQDAKSDGHWRIGGRRCVAYAPKGLSAADAAKRVDDMIKRQQEDAKREEAKREEAMKRGRGYRQ